MQNGRENILERLNGVLDAKSVPAETMPIPKNTNYKSQYDFTLKKMKMLISNGEIALENLIEIANETGEPRAYEVVSKLIKDISDTLQGIMKTTKDELEIQEKINGESPKNPSNNTTNVYFNGSLKDLISSVKEEEIIEVDGNIS